MCMVFKVHTLTSERSTELFLIVILYVVDTASDNIALLNNHLSMSTIQIELAAVNLGI